MSDIRLTQYSHGAGCGCKISPKILTEILGTSPSMNGKFPQLLVGNDHRDDAAVYDLGDGTALISTTDFFMPIVDHPATFGHIASVNAISDVYAMGGKPVLAIAILGWPVDKIPAEVANQVIEGAREACLAAGIPLAGGHSIDSPEPIFGLAVTGRVDIAHLKKNSEAKSGDLIFLTKPLGIGIYTTAKKKNLLAETHHADVCAVMMQLNDVGTALAGNPGVHAMTDVTGFGLAGHLLEMCTGSELCAEIRMDCIPLIDRNALLGYMNQGCIPGGTLRNFVSYGHQICNLTDEQKYILCDPQTSGGLLVAVDPASANEVEKILKKSTPSAQCIGSLHEPEYESPVLITVTS